MIATHNRCEDLRRTCTVLAALQPPPDETIVCADGCTDGTVAMLEREFPGFQVLQNETGQGSTASRDRMMRLARSELVLSLDDDSHPLETNAIARIRSLFIEHPRMAVASFPQRTDERPESLTAAGLGQPHFAGAYVNCACAFRRSVFIELGGHFAPFWNAYDEPDFALRCIAAGWQVRFDPAVTIRHRFSGVNRSHIRMHRMHARNEIWSALMHCPMPQLPAVAAWRTWRQFGYALKNGAGWAIREPVWWWSCWRGAGAALARRKPLPWKSYRAWMKLVAHPAPAPSEGEPGIH